ncbi:hypothetical protein E4U21_007719 [Claviceps maximensis]|nr:hypothetical protein E4U21_007719 [Claviceps maximensis]
MGTGMNNVQTRLGQRNNVVQAAGLVQSGGVGHDKPAPDLEERFNNPLDRLYHIVFAPINDAFAALLHTHLSDPVEGPRLVAVEALPNRTFTTVEGFQLVVAGNGPVVTNPGVLSSDPDNVPLPGPQANLVRRGESSSSSSSPSRHRPAKPEPEPGQGQGQELQQEQEHRHNGRRALLGRGPDGPAQHPRRRCPRLRAAARAVPALRQSWTGRQHDDDDGVSRARE